MDSNMHQNYIQLKYTWQARHGERNHANRHHGLLTISNAKCNKTFLVPDLVKIRKTWQKHIFYCCINRGITIRKSQKHDIAIYGHELDMMVIRHKQESRS